MFLNRNCTCVLSISTISEPLLKYLVRRKLYLEFTEGFKYSWYVYAISCVVRGTSFENNNPDFISIVMIIRVPSDSLTIWIVGIFFARTGLNPRLLLESLAYRPVKMVLIHCLFEYDRVLLNKLGSSKFVEMANTN